MVCLIFLNNPVNSIYTIDLDSITFKHPVDTLDTLMRYYNKTGFQYLVDGNFELAEKFMLKSLEIKEQLLSENDVRIGNDHSNLGVIYEKIWNYELALDHYNKAEEIFKNYDSNYVHIGSIYVNKAIIYRKLRDYNKAIDYCKNALIIFNRQDKIDYNKLFITNYNLGIINEYRGNYNLAIEYYKKSILYDQSKSQLSLLNIYSSLALNYSLLGNYDLAEQYYRICLDYVKKHLDEKNIQYISSHINYGTFKLDYREDLKGAKDLFYYSKRLCLDSYGEKNTLTANVYHNIGELFYKLNNLDSALFYLQKSLISEDLNFNDLNIYVNPEINIKNQRPSIINTLKFKAKTLERKYNQSENIEDIKCSLTTYLLVYDYIDFIRLKYESEESKFIISEQENETYLNGIRIANRLFNMTNDPKYIEIAFEINEKRQAFSLLTSIRKIEAKEFGGIPQHLLRQERDLSRQIAAYEEIIFEEKKLIQPNSFKISLWEERLFKLNQEYEKLINKFELEYPKYYQLKYDVSVESIQQIQEKLNQDQALINYSFSDSIVHYFIINNKNFTLIEQTIDSSFFTNLKILTIDLAHTNFSSGVHESYKKYTSAAYELYKVLIQPCQEMIRGKSLIIVPDGALSYLPFEALLTRPVMSDEPDYRNLPYLVRDYDIGYSYSATLHFEEQRRTTKPSGNLLAFAPEYSDLLAQNPDLSYLDVYRDKLIPIPGVKDEVKMISRMIKSDLYMDQQATENNFKKLAGNYDILHLAMHTIVDDDNPMYSKLAFTQNVDSFEDGFLNTYEIYNMKYNARLAVLSSCKTGFGKIQKGEGVMSLARGFMYAGCPSIVMTLWEVSDKSGARLMKDFYKSLKKGKNKTLSLREAKLEFLRKADQLKAHPFFWSTYVAIGDSSPLYPSRTKYLLIIIAALLIAASGAAAYWYFRIRPKRNKNNGELRQDKMYG